MRKNKLSFAIRTEDEGGFSAQCIEFPGIITQADTESELKEMIDDMQYLGIFKHFLKKKIDWRRSKRVR